MVQKIMDTYQMKPFVQPMLTIFIVTCEYCLSKVHIIKQNDKYYTLLHIKRIILSLQQELSVAQLSPSSI